MSIKLIGQCPRPHAVTYTYMIFHKFIFIQSPFVGTTGIFPSRVVSISCHETKYKYRLTSCGGNCDSSSVAVTGESLYDANCKCCQPAVYQTIDIPVICEGNLEQIAKFTNITMCKCQTFECQAGPSHNKQVQINGQGAVVDNNVQQKKRRRRALSRLFALPP